MRFFKFSHVALVLLALSGTLLQEMRPLHAQAPDTTAPQVTVTSPASNSQLASIPTITGTVQDEAGGSGVKSVGVALLRTSDNTWWTGGSWSSTFTLLPVTLSGTNWTISSPLPTGNNLSDGDYVAIAQVLDVAGNFRQAENTFKVRTDTTPPVVSITEPPDRSIIRRFSTISGTVQDNARINRVVVGILRTVVSGTTKTDLWWNGSAYTTTFSTLPAVLSGNTWTLSSNLPVGSNLPDGVYTIIAQAFDQSGNFKQSQVSVTVDNTAPSRVTVDNPSNNSIVRSLSVISGTAADTPNGTGVEQVTVFLRRNSDNRFWNGADWTTTRIALATNFTGFNWTRAAGAPGNLPTGADLQQGTYTLSATASDRAGNSANSSNVTFRVDKIAPAILNFNAPTGGAILRTLPAISGSAVDDPNGSGIDRVTVTILRLNDSRFWTGTTWGRFTPLTTQLSNGTWTRSTALPTGTNLQDGTYLLAAQAFDRAGNTIQVENVIRIDTRAPAQVTVATPINGKAINSLFSIRGTAADNTGGSGVNRVEITLRRNRDNLFWNGNAWGASATPLPTVFDGFNWSRSQNLPTGTDLAEGTYTITATAFDRVNNRASTTTNFFVDKTAPAAVTFTSPTIGATVRSLPRITGTAIDNPGGSGISTVNIAILRASDNRWWTGRTWGAFTELSTIRSGNNWSISSLLPPQTLLTRGVYVIIAFATDRAGNSIQASNAINVPGPIPTPIPAPTPVVDPVPAVTPTPMATAASRASTVALSTGTAKVAGSTVQLKFSGALDVEGASDPGHFKVTVNGRPIAVESAGYNAAARSILLGLPEGSLRSGDRVVVQWNGLSDATGSALAGQAGPIIAR